MMDIILKSEQPNVYALTCNLVKADPSTVRMDLLEIYLTPDQEYIFITPTAIAIADSLNDIQEAKLHLGGLA